MSKSGPKNLSLQKKFSRRPTVGTFQGSVVRVRSQKNDGKMIAAGRTGWEDGRTGGREDGRTGGLGGREDGRTGGREDGRTGGREDGLGGRAGRIGKD